MNLFQKSLALVLLFQAQTTAHRLSTETVPNAVPVENLVELNSDEESMKNPKWLDDIIRAVHDKVRDIGNAGTQEYNKQLRKITGDVERALEKKVQKYEKEIDTKK